MVRTQSALLCVLLSWVTASAALPLDTGIVLEGMSNKLRSGSIAIANPYQPTDMRRERIMKQNGGIVYLESEPRPEPEPEEPEEPEQAPASTPAEQPRARQRKPKGMAKLVKNPVTKV